MSRQVESCALMSLPAEVLAMILARVPLLDLANVRQVCHYLNQLVDGPGGRRLWATASLEGLAVDPEHHRLIERAADCGNREALIKLAMAYLYNQGVPKGAGAGTLDSWNGHCAAKFLFYLDSLSLHTRPLAWLLIRPPWSSSVSNKVCSYHKMIERCLGRQEGEEKAIPGLFYSLGQTVTFLEADGKESEAGQTSLDWFERGASHGCAFSALQVWRRTQKPHLAIKEVQVLRSLRKIIAMSNHSSLDAKLELCAAYAGGRYGSVGRESALAAIRELMMTSRPQLTHKIFRIQRDVTHIMRYITVDWMVEIAELKSLSSHTLHQAVALFDSYLMDRQVDRSALQLLGVTAILVASRWSGETMLTIRESSWLTENTYSYDEVVEMMAELLGTFRGDIRMFTVCDYLDVLLTLCQVSSSVQSMARYLSEGVLLHPVLTRFSSAHLAAACLLNAQILLEQEYPWSVHMEEATGFTLSSLCRCCLMIYHRCLTKECGMSDHRGVELCAIASRYSHPSHQSISKQEVMSLDELSAQLGVTPDSLLATPTPKPSSKTKDKLLSFLSDSCYLSSPLCLSGGSDSESELESESESDGTDDDIRVDMRCSRRSSLHSLPGSTTTGSSTPSHSMAHPRLLLTPPPFSHPHPVTHHHSSHYLDDVLALTDSLGHAQSSSGPLVPVATRNCNKTTLPPSQHYFCQEPSTPSLVRHPSLNRCDIGQCLPSLSGRTGKVHVSCPDFHSRTTDMESGPSKLPVSCPDFHSVDMELGSLSQEEGDEMDTQDSLSSTKSTNGGAILHKGSAEFNLPSLGEPSSSFGPPRPHSQLCNSNPPHENTTIWNPLPSRYPTWSDRFRDTANKPTPPARHVKQRFLPSSKKTSQRNPLQPLHNTPTVLSGRQATSQNKKQVSGVLTLSHTTGSTRD